jgi:hypothetical protein
MITLDLADKCGSIHVNDTSATTKKGYIQGGRCQSSIRMRDEEIQRQGQAK